MSTVLRVSLKGPEAALGKVAAADFARLLLGVERAVGRAAGHVIGREVKPTGRRGRTIEDRTRFRLVAIEEGSVVGVLELPDEVADEQTLDVGGPTLGETALRSALATVNLSAATVHGDVADAFVRLADEIGVGSRFDAVTFEASGAEPASVERAFLDRPTRERLHEIVNALPDQRDDTLVGVLFEADFEANSARVRTPSGQRISLSFDADLADEIQEGLRHQAQFIGEVRYDAKTKQARSVKLREILRGDQLALGLDATDFWAKRSIAEIAAEQGVRPVDDVTTLRDAEASHDEIDRLFAELAEM